MTLSAFPLKDKNRPSEIIKQVALLDIPPLTDEALTEIADALFVEHDKMEAEDAAKSHYHEPTLKIQIDKATDNI